MGPEELAASWEPHVVAHRFNLGSDTSRDGRRPPQDLVTKPAIFEPEGESWNFDNNVRDFGEEENPPKPHADP
jgi:hypothetical protein